MPRLSASIKRYTADRLWTTYRAAACNQLHSIPDRSARWLLLAHDNATGDTFQLTHRLLSQMLGVRRASVTTALGVLQQQGLIRYRRGRITILNRLLLEAEACECDGFIRARNKKSPFWHECKPQYRSACGQVRRCTSDLATTK